MEARFVSLPGRIKIFCRNDVLRHRRLTVIESLRSIFRTSVRRNRQHTALQNNGIINKSTPFDKVAVF
jgi:hypothetical protein